MGKSTAGNEKASRKNKENEWLIIGSKKKKKISEKTFLNKQGYCIFGIYN
ncbi:MAG: hypothetical protein IJE43_24880 [Alphaproteobacteria bacterium]|nr:hypothetical protein [Alphaproteobacteria bacterium]